MFRASTLVGLAVLLSCGAALAADPATSGSLSPTPPRAEASDAPAPAWRENFKQWNRAWDIRGVPGTPKAKFEVRPLTDREEQPALVMTSDRASATLMIPVKGVDLEKTPVMRWRWRAPKLPEGADGRVAGKDDQAIGIYVGTRAGWLRQNSIAYRWETLTPVGDKGTATYGAGTVRVAWFSLRNQRDGEGPAYEESRNVAEDFKSIYGEVPKEFALSVSCNSQGTDSKAQAVLEWIEFVPAPAESAPSVTPPPPPPEKVP